MELPTSLFGDEVAIVFLIHTEVRAAYVLSVETKRNKALLPPLRQIYLRVISVNSTKDSLTSMGRHVHRTIRLALTATDAVDIPVRFNQLDVVLIANTTGTGGSFNVVLPPTIRPGESILLAIHAACHLDPLFLSILDKVSSRDESLGELLRAGRTPDVWKSAKRNSVMFMLCNAAVGFRRKHETELVSTLDYSDPAWHLGSRGRSGRNEGHNQSCEKKLKDDHCGLN
jgi:hypothetical protein